MHTFVDLAAGRTQRSIAAGETLIGAGTTPDALFVLLEGSLRVEREGVMIASIDERGSCIGELSLLLGVPATADVTATTPSVVVAIEHAADALSADSELVLALARLLATRVQRMTTYLVDLQRQYADHEGGLGMIDVVLASLAHRGGARSELGSERDPQPEY